MQHWIKTVYNDDGREAAEDWRWLTCVSDGPPGRRPRYAVGDELLIYDSSQGTFPARARMTEEPDNLPGSSNARQVPAKAAAGRT